MTADNDADIDLRALINPAVMAIPKAFEEYGVARTGDPNPPERPAHFSSYDGATAYLRVVLAGSPVPGWTDPVWVGDVFLAPSSGPVWVQRTYITRPDTPDVDYVKVHERTEVGHGRHLTIALAPFVLDMTHISRLMATSSREVASALGVLAALTDERFALEVLAMNALAVAEGEVVRVFDVTPAIRHYVRDFSLTMDTIASNLRDDTYADVCRSARWYLKGAQEGPTPDGIVWLCTAIECLVDPPPGKRRKASTRRPSRTR
ncbi:MAG: hypothetical protein LC749_17150 [Actinobacteria bacterium]|nr:hypothetical protein [Actinomycetota bacterium]